MNRNDIHRPSLLDPSEYTYLGCFYQGSSQAMGLSYMQDEQELERAIETTGATKFSGNHDAKMTCDHCGAAFAHGACFLHKPTGTYITVGHICASDTIGLPTKAAAARKRAEKAAKYEKITAERREQFAKDGYGDVIEFLDSLDAATAHPFLRDMIANLKKWGSLFPKQAEAVRKFRDNAATFEARKAEREEKEVTPTTPVETGRREVAGLIVHTKFQDSDYGSTPKMLVVQDDGNKVWSTVPDHGFLVGEEGFELPLDNLKGRRVKFTATISVKDDPHFGLAKRPTNMTTEEVA